MNINRKSDSITTGKKRLSALGKGVAIAGIILIAAIIVFIIVLVNNNKIKNERMSELTNAISYGIQTCKNSVGGNTEALAEIERIAIEIEANKKADEKMELAQEAVRYALSLTNDTKAIDELNGSKNRINFAYKNMGGSK